MATLVLTAVGSLIAGPIGGSIGAIIGKSVDNSIFGPGSREGPRLKELAVSTSSYGQPLPRHFGTMRSAGSIIWATELEETKEKSGGGKGRPSATVFSYSASFAVALASRPIHSVGRIWADGNILRGNAGDLKVPGAVRVYRGYADQPVDPLIGSSEGDYAPAFRGTAYIVFEDLDLGEFGNRIPALTFEVIASVSPLTIAQIVEGQDRAITGSVDLPGLEGFSDEGGSLLQTLAAIDSVYPISADSGGECLSLNAGPTDLANAVLLPRPAALVGDADFGEADGKAVDREAGPKRTVGALRYYDTDRDFQPGLQRAEGRARPGYQQTIDFPGALNAREARALANRAAGRAVASKENLRWRLAELDPELTPGTIVRVPDESGYWRINRWEWRDRGIELDLSRIAFTVGNLPVADPGAAALAPDFLAAPTSLEAFALPPLEAENRAPGSIYAAASSPSPNWKGAALFADFDGQLAELGRSNPQRCVMGNLASTLETSNGLFFEERASFVVQLIGEDMALDPAGILDISLGANRALVGNEVLQFSRPTPLGGGRWAISGLLRGRGGTETSAVCGHAPGARFVVLDDAITPIALSALPQPENATIAALGLGDEEPVFANGGTGLLFRKPLGPVHPRASILPDGSLSLCWVRRARGSYLWRDEVDVPLDEETEKYAVGIGPASAPVAEWIVSEPRLQLSAAQLTDLQTAYSSEPVWVRQIGNFGRSRPTLLYTI
ncbi:phage tail protein [Altererythrobacter aquiaggeris]|uniref:phage tail protein n=1 Tax=Aestuarierythrobacter aquiaggeris TaxID=1898396 RepID=UPI003016403A